MVLFLFVAIGKVNFCPQCKSLISSSRNAFPFTVSGILESCLRQPTAVLFFSLVIIIIVDQKFAEHVLHKELTCIAIISARKTVKLGD